MNRAKQDLQTLGKVCLFHGIPREQLTELLSDDSCCVREYADGEELTGCGDNGRALGILLEGRAVVTTPDPGRSVLLRFLTGGDIFGVANLFSTQAPVSVIRADGACRCAILSEEAVAVLLEKNRCFRENYIGFLSGRIRFLNQKIGYLTAGGAERRLALYLSTLGAGDVTLRDSITSLSELLNLGRASLYRAFDRLCEDGFLIKNGKHLTLLNIDAMLKAYK